MSEDFIKEDMEYWNAFNDGVWVARNAKKMKCPFCKEKLVLGGRSAHQNLSEHVSAPNDEPRKKAYFVCKCKKAEKVFWDIGGAIYGDIGFREFKDVKTSAINSFQRELDNQNEREKLYKKWHVAGIISFFVCSYYTVRIWLEKRFKK